MRVGAAADILLCVSLVNRQYPLDTWNILFRNTEVSLEYMQTFRLVGKFKTCFRSSLQKLKRAYCPSAGASPHPSFLHIAPFLPYSLNHPNMPPPAARNSTAAVYARTTICCSKIIYSYNISFLLHASDRFPVFNARRTYLRRERETAPSLPPSQLAHPDAITPKKWNTSSLSITPTR